MKRTDGRELDQLRKLNITMCYMKNADGSCLIEMGDTKVVCTASIDKGVPMFLKNSGTGWLTAEYGMLPRSCTKRVQRERDKASGRTMEIQRLIGRSLRNVVNLSRIGERTIMVDCDVLQADGGTRTASVIGGFLAMVEGLRKLANSGQIGELPIIDYVAAISVGVIKGSPCLDLCFQEDSSADVDMNVVMKGSGEFIEVQGTGEKQSFSQEELISMLGLAKKGINEILTAQKTALGGETFGRK
jgi:ribonuclease PH